jgi:hypothetical protein
MLEAKQTTTKFLAEHHERMLVEDSGIDSEVVSERGYYTVTDVGELKCLGFVGAQLRVPALALPIHNIDGEYALTRIRPDHPRPDMTRPDRLVKYEQPPNTGVVLDVPKRCQSYLTDTERPLWVVEGEKKADCLASRGEIAIALLGVGCWKRDGQLLPDWDRIWLIGREINVAFDSDVGTKYQVALQRQRLAAMLEKRAGYAG